MSYMGHVFRSMPILPAEAMALLGWTSDEYDHRAASGKIKRSLDFSDLRPGILAAHSMWDVAEAKILNYFENHNDGRNYIDLELLETALDDLAFLIEHLSDCGQFCSASRSLAWEDFLDICRVFIEADHLHAEALIGIFAAIEDFAISAIGA